MRQIKFRGKRVDNGEWVYGYLMQMHQPDRLFIGNWNNIGGEATIKDELFSSYKEVIPETVGQFIGLLDKHENKIFEGDKVKMHQFLFDGNEHEKEVTGIIKWGEYGWLLSEIDNKEVKEYMGYSEDEKEAETYLIHFYGLHEESFEITGNIHTP